jgi:SAM-dependent methyltransferase
MLLIKSIFKLLFRQVERIIVFLLPDAQANLFQTSVQSWNTYFSGAEESFPSQWETIIWPLIKNFDFHDTLELAPGAGRNTEALCLVAKKLYVVDYSAAAIEKCRKRLGKSYKGCDIFYFVNNGRDLRIIPDQNISAVYCWDSAVHFNEVIIEHYIEEFARVLKEGGKGFIHHSNLGKSASRNIKVNPHWRSNVSKVFVADACNRNGLKVELQVDIPWGNIIDCVTVFCKSAQLPRLAP